MPELAELGFIGLLDRVYRTGEPYTGRDARLMLGTGTAAGEAFFDFTCEPRVDTGGKVTGVQVIGVETTQVKQAQWVIAEHRALLEQSRPPLPQVPAMPGAEAAVYYQSSRRGTGGRRGLLRPLLGGRRQSSCFFQRGTFQLVAPELRPLRRCGRRRYLRAPVRKMT